MQKTDTPIDGWTQAVAEAEQLVDERAEAEARARESHRPRSRGPVVVLLSVMLVVCLAGNVWLLLEPVTLPEPVAESENLLWSVVDAAEAVEDFRIENGRLPSSAEIGPELGADVDYERIEREYRVSVAGIETSMSYASSVPLEAWIAGMTRSTP